MRPFAFLLSGLALCAASSVLSSEIVTMHAKGTFDVKVTPQQPDNPDAQASGVGRLSLNKTFHGDLSGASHGEMLAFGDGTQSGGYVAIEKITATLDGREGSFALQHSAVMIDSAPQRWTIVVVPGSGTGALAGIDGAMTITIADGTHAYDFSYTLPDAE